MGRKDRRDSVHGGVMRFALEGFEVDQEELRIWRESYPRHADAVREIARAKIDGREPNLPPPQMFG